MAEFCGNDDFASHSALDESREAGGHELHPRQELGEGGGRSAPVEQALERGQERVGVQNNVV